MPDLRQQLLTNKKFNPFNQAFNVIGLQNALKAWAEGLAPEQKADVMPMVDTCRVITLLSAIFKNILEQIETNLLDSGLSYQAVLECLVAQHNGTYIDITNAYRKGQAGQGLELTEMFAHRSSSTDPSIGNINTSGGLVATIDVMNALMGSVGYFKDKMKSVSDQSDSLSIFYLNKLDLISNVYFGFKTSYDSLVCNDGFYKVTGKNKYTVWFKDHEKLVFEEIGRFRTQQDSLAHYLQMSEYFSKHPDSTLYPKEWSKRKIEDVQIREVSYTANGYIEYVLAPGTDSTEKGDELSFFGSIQAFYGFLENAELPKLNPLRLWDVLCLFSMIQHLFEKVASVAVEQGDCYTIAEVQHIPFRIVRKNLVDYLLARTTYTAAEVENFVNLLSNRPDDRVNFWQRPFLPAGDDLLVPFLTTVAPVTYYLIDYWLESAGYQLEKRGKTLEKHVKANLSRHLSRKGFTFNIPTASRFRIPSGAYEEIDLVLVLKDIVLVAEVKCIRYPMEPFDYHFSYNRLSEGAAQVNTKTNFLLAHAEELKPLTGDISSKKIVRAVITNYPIFTGRIIEDVPVIDFYLLEAYIAQSQIVHYASYSENNKIINKPEKSTALYQTEAEFCANLDDHLRNNRLLEIYKPKVKIHDQKMTVNEFPVEVYLQMAAFQEA
ncbi:hypothetical protein [Mucilaginibacter psychrotolerans]|uniref:NERD domain-containing protein n=1 Tax=Mucilaginibacter psychrotolerans TaxID=1524096 RepID=A0A4Y8S6A6_9SPHI|nr:hypothetical protein [Mucilaginibacter psychrotolerans]TFF34559.1 hypothetical protein E2R66_21665 [Mucilaginibacter psychrotolerans]